MSLLATYSRPSKGIIWLSSPLRHCQLKKKKKPSEDLGTFFYLWILLAARKCLTANQNSTRFRGPGLSFPLSPSWHILAPLPSECYHTQRLPVQFCNDVLHALSGILSPSLHHYLQGVDIMSARLIVYNSSGPVQGLAGLNSCELSKK